MGFELLWSNHCFSYRPIKDFTTGTGFEPMRAEHNGLAVYRLNHSATSSSSVSKVVELEKKRGFEI